MRAWGSLWFLLATSVAAASPVSLTHQTRLLDASGAPVHGAHAVRLTLWSHASSTDTANRLWTRSFPATTEDGFATFTLTTDESSVAVDSAWFAGDVWVGVAVDGGAELVPRSPLTAGPSAGYAHTAGSVPAGPTPSSPTCATTGAIRWDTSTKNLIVCDGTWRSVGVATIIVTGGARRWSDGSVSKSCEAYRRPSQGRIYDGATGDGLYVIDPDASGGAYGETTVYCNMTNHEGGWTLALSAGFNVNLTSGVSGGFSPYPQSAAQPGTGVLNKMPDAMINAVRTATGSSIAYWVTTPGSGSGTLGAEIFHRADCTFQTSRTEQDLRSTSCDEWTISYSTSPSWSQGGYWHPNSPGYYWAFGHGRSETIGTNGSCFTDGSGLGVHEAPYHPFHRGWCGTQAWGQVWVR